MNKKSIIILAIITLILFMGYTLTNREPKAAFNAETLVTGARPFEGVDFNQVAVIRISGQSQTTHLARVDGVWSVDQKNGYPSDFEKLSTLVRNLLEQEVGQEMPSGDAYLAEYGLAEDGETTPVKLNFETESGESLLALTVGTTRERGGQFVQLESGQIALLNETMTGLIDDPNQWIDRSLINLNESEIDTVEVNAEEGSYTLRVISPGQYQLEDLKENETLKQYEPSRLGRALQNLMLVSVFDAEEEIDFGFEGGESFVAKTKDGRLYTATLGSVTEDPNNRYVKLTVQYTAPEAPSLDDVALQLTKAAQEKADGEPVDDDALIEEIAKAHAARIAAHQEETTRVQEIVDQQTAAWSPWVFSVMNFNADSMTLPRDSLVEVKEEEPKE